MNNWERYQELGQKEFGLLLQYDLLVRQRTIDYLKIKGGPWTGAGLFTEVHSFANRLTGVGTMRDAVAQVLLLCEEDFITSNGDLETTDFQELCRMHFYITPKGYLWDRDLPLEVEEKQDDWSQNIFNIDDYRNDRSEP